MPSRPPAASELPSSRVSVRIRDARATDLPGIAGFFRRIVADGETYAYPGRLEDEQIQAAWFAEPEGRTSVAVDATGTVLGSARMGPVRPGRGSHIGTASFMVDPDAQGQGIGRALAVDMIDWHRAHGFRAIQFNAVVETNTAAVALWRDLGFSILATVPRAFDSRRHGLVGLHIMLLEL